MNKPKAQLSWERGSLDILAAAIIKEQCCIGLLALARSLNINSFWFSRPLCRFWTNAHSLQVIQTRKSNYEIYSDSQDTRWHSQYRMQRRWIYSWLSGRGRAWRPLLLSSRSLQHLYRKGRIRNSWSVRSKLPRRRPVGGWLRAYVRGLPNIRLHNHHSPRREPLLSHSCLAKQFLQQQPHDLPAALWHQCQGVGADCFR